MSRTEEDVEAADRTHESEDESTNESSGSDDDDEEDAAENTGFLDVMAVEAQDGDESSDGSGTDDEFDESSESFHLFLRLPFELRRRIWELFSPELRLQPRILEFSFSFGTARHRDPSWPSTKKVITVHDGMTLQDSTAPIRTVLSVHQESRAMALSVLTDTLAIDAGSGDALVRFNRDTDLVMARGLWGAGIEDAFHLPEFASNIKNLALDEAEASSPHLTGVVSNLIQDCPSLETLFLSMPSGRFRKRNLTWCTSDLVNRSYTETFEKMPGFGEDMQYLYCWPDLHNHKDFAKFQVSRENCTDLLEPLVSELSQRGIEPWPLVLFTKMHRYEALLQFDPDKDDDDSDDSVSEATSDGSQTDVNEYESDGIDDAEILETFGSSDEGDDLESTSDRDIEVDGGDLEARFSSPELDGGEIEGRFSSPEPESGSDRELASMIRGRKRRIVSDSDDDSDAPDEPTAKRARTAHVVLSDSESDRASAQEPGRSRPGRQSRVVLSDSEEEDTGDTHTLPKESNGSGEDDDPPSLPSETSDGSDDDEDSDQDEDEPPKQLSLAERLRLHRDANPVSSPEGSGDNSSRAAGSEDDDDDVEDGDEDDMGNGLIDAMAEDEDDNGDEDEEGYYDDG
ncbi:Fc.00g033550.m01.CDS01 [Cosmosporella sp. VM-42]